MSYINCSWSTFLRRFCTVVFDLINYSIVIFIPLMNKNRGRVCVHPLQMAQKQMEPWCSFFKMLSYHARHVDHKAK